MIALAFLVTAFAGCTEEEKKTKVVADAGNDKIAAYGDSIVFNGADSKGDELNYSWQFGDGASDTGEVVEHTYDTSGIYTATLTVTDKHDKSDTATINVSIKPKANAGAEIHGVMGQNIEFDGTGSRGEGLNFTWDFDDGSTGYGATPTHQFSAVKSYTVTLTVTDEDGLTDTDTVAVVIGANNLPLPVAAAPESPSVGEEVTFDASGSSDEGGEIVQYEWDFDGNGTYDATGVTATHTYTAEGTYHVTLRVTDNLGEEQTTTIVVTVSESAPPTGYTTVTVDDLAANFAAHENDLVKIVDAEVSAVDWERKFSIKDEGGTEELIVYCEPDADYPTGISVGDTVTVQGQLIWYDTGSYYEIEVRNSTDDKVQKTGDAPPEDYTTTTVDALVANLAGNEDELVRIEDAEVVNVEMVYKFTIMDEGGSEELLVYCQQYSDRPDSIVVGDTVTVHGQLILYNTTWEISIRASTDDKVEKTGEAPPQDYTTMTVDTLMANPADHENDLVVIEGAEVTTVDAVYIFNIMDDGGSEELLVYCESGGTRPDEINTGDIVTVQGIVTEYQGDWEIKIRADTDDKVEITDDVPPQPTDYTTVTVDDLLANPATYDGEPVKVVEVEVTRYESMYNFSVRDQSGTTELLVYAQSSANKPVALNLSDIVTIQAEFTEYEGEWELKVRGSSEDYISVIDPADYTPITLAELVADPASHQGQLVLLEDVEVVEGFDAPRSEGVEFNITDGTNTMLVYAASNATRPQSVAAGDHVDIQGKIVAYYDEYEVKIFAGEGEITMAA